MLTADIIVLAGSLLFMLVGAIVGFGKGLKFFTSGIFGVIISVFVCYIIYGFVLDWEFVRNLLDKFNAWLAEQGSVGTFFADIHTDRIALAVALFAIVQIIRIIVVSIIKSIVEINVLGLKIINKLLGIVFFFAVALAILLVVFQIVAWVGGDTATDFAEKLGGSIFKLDVLFENNPLKSVFAK